jgi:hypothetical protein
MTIQKNTLKSIAIAVSLSCGALSLSAIAHDTHTHKATASVQALEKAVAGDHRSAKNKARDEYRHPVKTLEFFWLQTRYDCCRNYARRWMVY